MDLNGITLPDDLEWTNEFTWTPVTQNTNYSTTGSLFIQESVMQTGRPISLEGEEDMCWVTRKTILDLQALQNEPGKEMTLTLSDGRQFNVMFIQSETPIDASPLRKGAYFDDNDYYKLNSIKLMEV